MISLFASAARPKFWMRMYDSLSQNKVPFEICFVGPVRPEFTLPSNFHYEHSDCKPCQCYEAAARMCSGTLIGWTADDADYNEPSLDCPNALDIIWNAYRESDKKTILAQRTIEDGADISDRHHFFHGMPTTPMMAPLGFINREWYMSLGGYDRNFICGQAENDIVMRAVADGGQVKFVPDSKIYIHHGECHGEYNFRDGYNSDREFLENCWIEEGYGTYETHMPFTLATHRLITFHGFSDENLLSENQGPAGKWEYVNT